MKRWLFLILCLIWVVPVRADTRVNLLTRLNQILDDVDNRKSSQADKIVALNAIGREYGRMGFYAKRDTIITAAEVETYAMNTDAAGLIESAYWKIGQDRIGLPVIDRDSSFKAPDVTAGTLAYVYVDKDNRLGVEALPLSSDTIILIYFAYPAALSGDSTEWSIRDDAEGPALLEAAADIVRKLPTAWATQKEQDYLRAAAEKLARLGNPATESRKVGATDR